MDVRMIEKQCSEKAKKKLYQENCIKICVIEIIPITNNVLPRRIWCS
jgi:hypothetical protein